MRIVVAQLNYHIGHFELNAEKIKQVISEHAEHADFIVFSELCLTGYYPYDLIDRQSFVQAQFEALTLIKKYTEQFDCYVVLGILEPNPGKGKSYFNSAVVIHQGKQVYAYHKQLLPVYNIFDEARHFEPGHFQELFEWKGHRIGFLLCEDAWGTFRELYKHDPIDLLKGQQPTLTIVLNASPSNLGKREDRIIQMSRAVKTLNTPLIYINQVGGCDDMVYDGQSFVMNAQGDVLGGLTPFKEDVADIEINENGLTLGNAWQSFAPMSDSELLYEQIILGLRDYVAKSGFKGVVIGISGGIDSAITCGLAAVTLGKENVKGILMPTRYTSQESIQAAKDLCNNLGVQLYHYPLESSYVTALEDFKKAFGESASDITAQNIQARIRGRILMEYSNHTGFMVLSTGNKSELSVGYTTLYGDMTGGFNMIGDVYKTQVYDLARYFNQKHNHAIPDIILTRAPSAELAQDQRDTDTLPPYEQLDNILKLYLEGDLLPEDQRKACQQAVSQYPSDVCERVYRMVDRAEFKRRQSPPIVRCQRRSFGWGRKMPISAKYSNP